MNGVIRAPIRSCARNLFRNSDFSNPVNSRGKMIYTSNFALCIDGWYVSSTSADDQIAATVSIVDGGLMVSAASNGMVYLIQRLPREALCAGKTYTAVMCKNDGSVVFGSVNDYVDSHGFWQIEFALSDGDTVIWAALDKGTYTADTLLQYTHKGYAQELAECAWYFRIFESYSAAPCGYAGYTHSATVARFLLPLGLPMRADSIPVISVNNLSTWRIMCNGSTYVPTRIISVGISKSGAGMTQFSLEIESSGMPANHAATLKIMSSFSVSNEL